MKSFTQIMLRVSFVLFFFGILVQPALAAVYEIPLNSIELDHFQYYIWGINWTPPANENIVSASLTIKDINNWFPENNDQLTIHLLDSASVGLNTYYDGQGGGDNIASLPGDKTLLDIYHDPVDAPNAASTNKFVNAETYFYPFTQSELGALIDYSSDYNFGFGFDPDCHYWNHGLFVTIETETNKVLIPEPGTLGLLLTGLTGLALRNRKKKFLPALR